MIKQLYLRLCVNIRKDRRIFVTTFKSLLVLMIGVCIGCSTAVEKSVACPAIEMSVVADVQSDSTRPATRDDGTKLSLTRTPVVTSADIAGASASQHGKEWVLNLDVTEAGARRLHDFSKQNVGRTMALLAEGKVRSTPTIAGPLTGKGARIGPFEQADAERLATAINNGCKRS